MPSAGAESGKLCPERKPVDLHAVLEAAATVVRPQTGPGVALQLSIPAALPRLLSDGTMLLQTFTNLLQAPSHSLPVPRASSAAPAE